MMKKKSEYFKCRTFSTEIFQLESIFFFIGKSIGQIESNLGL